MTTEAIAATITDYVAPDVLVQQLNTKLTDLETKVSNCMKTINDQRDKVRDLYTHLNDIIESDECDESAEISFGDLSILLSEIFGSELVFTKEYEVQVRYVMDATFKIRAASEDDARSIAEDIGLSTDPDFDIDSDTTEVDSCVVDQSRIDYVGKA
jgi:hypothetical protein